MSPPPAILLRQSARRPADAHAESDVDVLVVLDGEVDYLAKVRRMLDLMTELLHRYDLVVSLKPVPLATYVNEQHPLMMNVHREGTVLA